MIKSCKEHLSLSRIWLGCFTEFVPPGECIASQRTEGKGGGGCCFDCFNARSEPRVSTRSGSGPGTSEGVTQPSYVWLPPDYWDVDNRQTQGAGWARSPAHCVLLYFENRELGEAQVRLEYLIFNPSTNFIFHLKLTQEPKLTDY